MANSVQLLDGNPFSDIKEVSVDEDGQEDKLGTKMENKFILTHRLEIMKSGG